MFTILFGVLVTLIYFLFSFRDNNYQKNKTTTDFHNNIYQIVFTNKYNLPLLNKNIIPTPLQITEQMLGISIEEILLKFNFKFQNYMPINKNTLQKKYRQMTSIGLIPNPKYIKWYQRHLINKQLLNQVLIPQFLQSQIINILQLKIADTKIIVNKLQQYLTGIYVKYFNIIRLFCVF